MILNCNHECDKCPAMTLGGKTRCIIINEIMKKLGFETDTARIIRNITYKENKQ